MNRIFDFAFVQDYLLLATVLITKRDTRKKGKKGKKKSVLFRGSEKRSMDFRSIGGRGGISGATILQSIIADRDS